MTHTLTGGGITAEIDLADGGRLTGLAALGRQWLAGCGPRTPGDYLQAGSGGWDEISPTVSACVLADGTELPDHGDAWQTEWTLVSAGDTHVEATVDLTSLPITLWRRIDATNSGLRLSYSASTSSSRPVPLFWCAHPLFAAYPGTRLRAAGAPRLTEEYPGPRRAREWPEHVGGSAVKAFAEGPVASASVEHADGAALTLAWDPALLPYLGLYWDGGEFTTVPVVAIEPSTGYGDSAARASADGRVHELRAGSPFRWWIDVTATSSR